MIWSHSGRHIALSAMRGDMGATCFSVPLKGVLLQKYFPLAVCLFGGFYVLLYSGMVLKSFNSVCIIKREIGPNMYEIEDPREGYHRIAPAPDIKTQRVQKRRKAGPKTHEKSPELVIPGADETYPGLYTDDEDSLEEEEEDLEVYPDPSLEKYGLTESDCNCTSRWGSTRVKAKYLCMNLHRRDPAAEPTLVTLFTTLGDDHGRTNVHINTVRMWRKLGPKVRTILFVTCAMIDTPLVDDACKEGWDVALVPACDGNDMPVLRTMFLAAQIISSSSYYGYANADILFTNGLVDTLEFLQPQIQKTKQFQQNLIVGSKTNLEIDPKLYINSLDQIVNLSKGLEPAFVTFIDYVISSSGGFPWESVPPLVIGRRAYDNYIVTYARRNKVSTFDATDTILAAHQGGPGISWVPHPERQGADVNLKLIGRNADLLEGLISCTKFKIRSDSKTQFGLYWRKKPLFCGQKMWPRRSDWKELTAKDGFRKIRLRT